MKQLTIFISSFILVAVVIYFGYYFPVWLTASLIAGVVLVAVLINHAPKYIKRKKQAKAETAPPKIIAIGNLKLRKSYFIIGVIILILTLFNPTLKDFNEYSDGNSSRRTGYFLIGSVFIDHTYQRTRVFIGIFKNFIYVGSI